MKNLLIIFLTIFISASPCTSDDSNKGETVDYWSQFLLKEVTVEGLAQNAKFGAYLQLSDPSKSIWINSLSFWPEKYRGKKVSVTGTVIKRYDLPVFIQKIGEPSRTGIPVREGTDLHSASKRYLLENARWSASF